jgi:hypothetical protein
MFIMTTSFIRTIIVFELFAYGHGPPRPILPTKWWCRYCLVLDTLYHVSRLGTASTTMRLCLILIIKITQSIAVERGLTPIKNLYAQTHQQTGTGFFFIRLANETQTPASLRCAVARRCSGLYGQRIDHRFLRWDLFCSCPSW